jgi:hypothetical protein
MHVWYSRVCNQSTFLIGLNHSLSSPEIQLDYSKSKQGSLQCRGIGGQNQQTCDSGRFFLGSSYIFGLGSFGHCLCMLQNLFLLGQ